MADLVLKNVNKIYPGGQQAVRDFHLEIKKGEFLILAGPEGCGKSTLLRLLAGLEELNSGEILMNGENLKDVEPRNRQMAMIFKNSVLYPELSVADNLSFALKMVKLAPVEIESRVAKTAEFFKLENILDRMPQALTVEETYRALLARAVTRYPRVLLLDRPVSGMDHDQQVPIWKLLEDTYKTLGITVIYATDNQETARHLGTRMIVMKDGIICQDDIPKNIYEKPATSFVAGYVGNPPMNIFPSKVAQKGDMVVFKVAGGELSLPKEREEAFLLAAPDLKEVFLGLRPEDIRPVSGPGAADFMAESLGGVVIAGKNYQRFLLEETEGLALITGEAVDSGKKVYFTADTEKLYLFNRDNEKSIFN